MGLKVSTVVSIRILFLVTLAYFLLVSPEKLYTNFAVVGIGYVVSPEVGAGSEGWIGTLLLLQAIDDFMRLSGPQVNESFMHVLPMRMIALLFFFTLCYYFKVGTLSTGPTFMYLFYDTILSGWCFLAVREQLNEDNKAIVRDSRGYAEDVHKQS